METDAEHEAGNELMNSSAFTIYHNRGHISSKIPSS
jgi:hypothetical protein